MTLSRRGLLGTGLATGGLGLGGAGCATMPGAAQPPQRFDATWESLIAGYQTPDWFRDAKFGIWAHWGPQCVPEFGDWYGRQMYIQGNPFYDHHVATYGHPSDFGFVDIIEMWKAEAWDPEALLDLYQAAGARYFMAMANHHDNLDLFDSRHHGWNSTRVGPRVDIIGTWEKLVRQRGMRFAVSNHGAHAWHWWQTAYGYDAEGPKKGVRYDAYGLTAADGVGKSWEGLDPQHLYTGPHMVVPDGIDTIAAMNAWHENHDSHWVETPPPNDPSFALSWEMRQRDLVDRYKPDMVYFDNTGLPLGQSGLDATAYYYNASLAWRGELPVVNGKRLDERQRKGVTDTLERGYSDVLRPEPWQTDTCIGDWHYNRGRYNDHSYVPARSVIQRLVDTVSKNGNLMLNIPLRGDGSIDSDERAILESIAAWMGVGGEGIFETRPWKMYGEGPTQLDVGWMAEKSAAVTWTAHDIRFTTKGQRLYAFAMEWPDDGRIVINALGRQALGGKAVQRVEMFGGTDPLSFEQTADALTITVPGGRPVQYAPGFRILGDGLV